MRASYTRPVRPVLVGERFAPSARHEVTGRGLTQDGAHGMHHRPHVPADVPAQVDHPPAPGPFVGGPYRRHRVLVERSSFADDSWNVYVSEATGEGTNDRRLIEGSLPRRQADRSRSDFAGSSK